MGKNKIIILVFLLIVVILVAVLVVVRQNKTNVVADSHDAVYNEDNEYTMYSAIANSAGSILASTFNMIGNSKKTR